MKFIALFAVTLMTASSAFAYGFVCQARNASLVIKAYNHTAASGKTGPSIMILADPLSKAGEQTIAKFSDAEGTLSGTTSSFVADVDLRFKDQHNKEALVAGKAQLQELDTVVLDVDYDPSQNLSAAEQLNGTIQLNLRTGGQIDFDAVLLSDFEQLIQQSQFR